MPSVFDEYCQVWTDQAIYSNVLEHALLIDLQQPNQSEGQSNAAAINSTSYSSIRKSCPTNPLIWIVSSGRQLGWISIPTTWRGKLAWRVSGLGTSHSLPQEHRSTLQCLWCPMSSSGYASLSPLLTCYFCCTSLHLDHVVDPRLMCGDFMVPIKPKNPNLLSSQSSHDPL